MAGRGRTVAIDTTKIDVLAEAIQGIRQMQDEIDALEILQNSADETQRPGEVWIHFQKLVVKAARDICNNQVDTLNLEEVMMLGTRIGAF